MTGYDYAFPKKSIAQRPASPRDGARLLVYRRRDKKVRYDTFRNLADYLPSKSVIILNKTKVVPARLEARKPTGGRVRLLYVRTDGKHLRMLADRPLASGATVTAAPGIAFLVESRDADGYVLTPSFPVKKIFSVLEKYGRTPLPPYIKHATKNEKKLREQYQTVFARERGSVAAPTASLHFTPRLLAALKKAGHDIRFVTLHVNLGTFAPLTERQLREGKLHEERYEIDAKTAAFLRAAKKQGRPIVAVGTTVVRALESAADARGRVRAGAGATRLFIREGYRFRVADGVITNFHVPRSSLLMLVAAFAGRKTILDLYRKAIRKKFRLFSFGDGMLLR